MSTSADGASTTGRLGPWREIDLVAVVCWNAVALAVLITAVVLTNRHDAIDAQVPAANVAVLAIAGAAAANAIWLLAGRGAVRRRMSTLHRELIPDAEPDTPPE